MRFFLVKRTLIALMAITLSTMELVNFLSAHRALMEELVGGYDSLRDSFMVSGSTHLREKSKEDEYYPLPSVLLIGVQKSGTTALSHWLFNGGYRKSRVFLGEPDYYEKEPNFFDNPKSFQKGIKFYAHRFQTDAGEFAGPALDATPGTFQYPERVRETYLKAGGNQAENVKMIVLLRDPVAREVSLYNHVANDYLTNAEPLNPWYKPIGQKDGSIMSFDKFVDTVSIPTLIGKDSCALCPSSKNNMYASYLEKWFNLFSRQQILVVSYEELKRNEKAVRQRIIMFLGRNIPGTIKMKNVKRNKQKLEEPSSEAREKLLRMLKPHNEKLYRLLDERPGPPMEQRPFPRFPEN